VVSGGGFVSLLELGGSGNILMNTRKFVMRLTNMDIELIEFVSDLNSHAAAGFGSSSEQFLSHLFVS